MAAFWQAKTGNAANNAMKIWPNPRGAHETGRIRERVSMS
jgi:hypothetical protein